MFKKILKLTTFIFLLICLTLSNSVINAGNSQSSTTETTQGGGGSSGGGGATRGF